VNDDSRLILRLILENGRRLFCTLTGIAVGLIAVYYGLGKGLLFAVCVVAGYGIGRLLEREELVSLFLSRASGRRRR
jgi:uncharacterized membrane protein